MSTRFVSRWVAVVAAVVAVTCLSSTAQAQEPPEGALARILGGGRAEVTNDDGGFLPAGAVTEFSVNVWVDDPILGDTGRFVCFVQGGEGGFVADITGAEVLPDDSVLLTGLATCVLSPIGLEVFFDEPVTICVFDGGPDVGGFDVLFDNFAVLGADEETVINGRINIFIND